MSSPTSCFPFFTLLLFCLHTPIITAQIIDTTPFLNLNLPQCQDPGIQPSNNNPEYGRESVTATSFPNLFPTVFFLDSQANQPQRTYTCTYNHILINATYSTKTLDTPLAANEIIQVADDAANAIAKDTASPQKASSHVSGDAELYVQPYACDGIYINPPSSVSGPVEPAKEGELTSGLEGLETLFKSSLDYPPNYQADQPVARPPALAGVEALLFVERNGEEPAHQPAHPPRKVAIAAVYVGRKGEERTGGIGYTCPTS